ncbi:hypothetical protein [Fictibacillus phosphorivorans]|nr:hypothetical protein [Fictibacillus phosphorivorans]
MMDFILENKWQFLIIAEVFFWIFSLTFLVVRYWFNLKKLSIVFFFLFIINDLWIATMGFMDYLKTGNFTSYQIVILIIIVYALTYGKSDFRKLDIFIQKKVAKWKGEPIPELKGPEKLYGKDLARQERKHFAIHLSIFILAHIGMFLVYGLSDQLTQTENIEQLLSQWFSSKDALYPFNNKSMNNLSRIWTLVLVIDGVTSLSYTFFPKNEKKSVFSNN